MEDNTDRFFIGFWPGLFFGAMVGLVLGATIYLFWEPYEVIEPNCFEDEVYAWQQNGGDFPDRVTWACVPLDNLIVLEGE